MARNGKPNYGVIQKHVFDHIHSTAQDIKNDFPNWLEVVAKHEMWKHFRDHEGKPFTNIGDWLVATFPNGCSMGGTRYALTYEEAMKLTEGHAIHDLLVKSAPKRGRGRPKEADNVPRGTFKRGGTFKRATLEARLAQEHPKIYADYQLGKYKSVRAAAVAAGLVAEGHDPVKRMKSYWRKASAEQREEIRKWLRTTDAKILPE